MQRVRCAFSAQKGSMAAKKRSAENKKKESASVATLLDGGGEMDDLEQAPNKSAGDWRLAHARTGRGKRAKRVRRAKQ